MSSIADRRRPRGQVAVRPVGEAGAPELSAASAISAGSSP